MLWRPCYCPNDFFFEYGGSKWRGSILISVSVIGLHSQRSFERYKNPVNYVKTVPRCKKIYPISSQQYALCSNATSKIIQYIFFTSLPCRYDQYPNAMNLAYKKQCGMICMLASWLWDSNKLPVMALP